MGNNRHGKHRQGSVATSSEKVENNGLQQEEIQLRAYYRYCDRGCAPGGELEDWLAAEREVATQRAGEASKAR